MAQCALGFAHALRLQRFGRACTAQTRFLQLPKLAMPQVPWIAVALGAAALAALLAAAWFVQRRKKNSEILTEWALTTRPLFNPHERLCFRLLRDALPHHVVLAKMPLVRFCRPVDQTQVGYWHDLLGSIYVSFVVCAPNGRVLAALDLDSTHRSPSRRIATIKHEVLQACSIRYVKCRPDQFPSVAELQMLVPHQGIAGRAAVPDTVDSVRKVHATLAHTVRALRPGKAAGPWGDSTIGNDSFFAPDSRLDDFAPTDPLPDPGAVTAPAPPGGLTRAGSPARAGTGAAHSGNGDKLPFLLNPPLQLRPDDTVH
jgi:Protein of unknown function (DUF2726)